jgi:hypothetical protein
VSLVGPNILRVPFPTVAATRFRLYHKLEIVVLRAFFQTGTEVIILFGPTPPVAVGLEGLSLASDTGSTLTTSSGAITTAAAAAAAPAAAAAAAAPAASAGAATTTAAAATTIRRAAAYVVHDVAAWVIRPLEVSVLTPAVATARFAFNNIVVSFVRGAVLKALVELTVLLRPSAPTHPVISRLQSLSSMRTLGTAEGPSSSLSWRML